MAARLSIPTLGTFVSPFVCLVLISPSQPRKTTAAFSRLYAPSSSSLFAGWSFSRRRSSRCHALAPSICLSLPIFPPHLSFSLSLSIRLAAASVSAPRCAALEVTRSSCFPLARSRARSSPSFQLFVSYFVPRCLSALHSSLFPHHPSTTCFSREEPRFSRDRRNDTRIRAPSPPIPYNSPPSLVQRYFMQILRHRIPFRFTMPRFSRKITGSSVGLNSRSRMTWKYWFNIIASNEKKRGELDDNKSRTRMLAHIIALIIISIWK